MIDLRFGYSYLNEYKDDERQEHWKKEREELGFDETEVWSLDISVIKFILPRLEYMRDLRPQDDNCMIDAMIAGCYDYLLEDGAPSESTMEAVNFMFESFRELWV